MLNKLVDDLSPNSAKKKDLTQGSVVGHKGRLHKPFKKRACQTVTRFRLACSCLLGLSLATLLGCATSSYTPFISAVTATAHPLVAQYSVRQFHTGFSVWVEYGLDTSYGRQTSAVSNSSNVQGGAEVDVLVAGMLPETTYHMRAHIDSPTGSWVDQDHTFKTGAIPASVSLPQISVNHPTGEPGSPSGGVEMLSLVNTPTNGLQGIATDLEGRVIWYCGGEAIPLKPMDNGHFIFMRGNGLEEVDLACNTIRLVTVNQLNQSLQAHGYAWPPLDALHHDMLVLPNGHWIALAQVTKSVTANGYGTLDVFGDVVMDIDPAGDVVWAWSAFDHLDLNRHIFGLPDWTHSNALVYTADGNLLMSMRGQSWILKLDYANGKGKGDILWKLGHAEPGETSDFAMSGGDPSQWFYAQHNPSVLSVNGSQSTLSIFDNGNYRLDSGGVECGTSTSAPACYTRAAILQIDESARTAKVTWQYLPGFYSFWGGSTTVLDSGNVEFNSSEPFPTVTPLESLITEVTQTSNPEIVWQMTVVGENAYRGFRIPSLYPGVSWTQ
jgi:arylsulfate sulfotransferase